MNVKFLSHISNQSTLLTVKICLNLYNSGMNMKSDPLPMEFTSFVAEAQMNRSIRMAMNLTPKLIIVNADISEVRQYLNQGNHTIITQ